MAICVFHRNINRNTQRSAEDVIVQTAPVGEQNIDNLNCERKWNSLYTSLNRILIIVREKCSMNSLRTEMEHNFDKY